jgi:magnesium-transporting ATPase (P-type)
MESVAAMSAYFLVLHQGGWHFVGQLGRIDPLYLQATTACLSAIIAMQVINVFICRTEQESVVRQCIRGNYLILWGVATEITLILLIDYSGWGQLLFGTAPISATTWIFIAGLALALLSVEECRRWLARSRSSASGKVRVASRASTNIQI